MTDLLFDQIKVALADPQRRLRGHWNERDPKARAWLKQISDKITRAVRFELSDDFTALAQRASLLDPDRLATLYSHAWAPYDLMWIEWDPKVRSRVSKEWSDENNQYLEPTDLPLDDRHGFLVERDIRFADRHVYRIYPFVSGPNSVMGWPLGLIYDIDGHSPTDCMSAFDRAMGDLVNRVEDHSMVLALGVGWVAAYSQNRERTDKQLKLDITNHLSALRYMMESARYTCSGAFGTHILDMAPKLKTSALHTMFVNGSGDLRWIAALLGLMQTVRVEQGPVAQVPHDSTERIIWGRRVPYLEYRRLTVRLPTKPLAQIVHPFSTTGRPRRAHLVRGYERRDWRTGQISRIRPHQRGDASIGFVHKSYWVEPSEKE